jgi:carboxylesterase
LVIEGLASIGKIKRMTSRKKKIMTTVLISLLAFLVIGDAGFTWVTHSRCKTWEKHIVRDADGVRQHCAEFTVGEGPVAILLVHGFGDSPQIWRKMAPVLAEQGFHCRALRLPGHAMTIDHAEDVQSEEWMAKVKEELAILNESHDEVWVVAHSMGSAISLRTLIDDQELADGLVVIAPLIEVEDKCSPLLKPKTWFSISQRILPFSDMTESYFPVDIHGTTPRDEVYRDIFIPTRTMKNLFETTSAIEGRAAEFELPFLMFLSEADLVIDSEAARDYYQESSSDLKQIVYLEDAGHVLPLDNGWEDICRHIGEFIQKKKPVEPSGALIPTP